MLTRPRKEEHRKIEVPLLGRKGEVRCIKKNEKRLSICFFSFVPSAFLPLLASKRYLRPKGRQPFQRNMIAALLRKAFHLEICDFQLGEKAEAFPLPSLLFSTTQNHGRERPCVSEKSLSRHLCFQGPALNSSGTDIRITNQIKMKIKFLVYFHLKTLTCCDLLFKLIFQIHSVLEVINIVIFREKVSLNIIKCFISSQKTFFFFTFTPECCVILWP